MPPVPLLQALPQRPFKPFRLHGSGGTVYEVRHPELVMVAPGYAIVGLPPATPQPATIERHEVVDLQHIIRLEPLAAPTVQKDGAA